MTTILTIDIGGTKTEAALWQSCCTQPKLLQKCRFATTYPDEQALWAALAPLGIGDDTEAAVLAVAGRINNTDGDITLTNNPCKLNISRLQAALPVGCRLSVLNDLEALAFALPYLAPSAACGLNPTAATDKLYAPGPRLVAACGTGFGAAALLPGMRVLPTEAGHSRFTPANAQQADICRKICPTAPYSLTVENLLCGRGLAAIYTATSGIAPTDAAAVCAAAQQGNAAAVQTVAMFSQMLGSALANLALCYLPGTIYLAGGVCRNLGSLLSGKALHSGLIIPGPFADYLADLPVMLITEEAPTLLGAVMYAERFLLG